MTREVIDTFRAIGAIQSATAKKMAHRYIISFYQERSHVADVFELREPVLRARGGCPRARRDPAV